MVQVIKATQELWSTSTLVSKREYYNINKLDLSVGDIVVVLEDSLGHTILVRVTDVVTNPGYHSSFLSPVVTKYGDPLSKELVDITRAEYRSYSSSLYRDTVLEQVKDLLEDKSITIDDIIESTSNRGKV